MKNKTETILRTNKKNFQDEEFPHELFLATRRTTKKKMPLLTICQQMELLVLS